MQTHRPSPWRLAIVWLLAVLLPAQAMAIVALWTLGPAHVHRPELHLIVRLESPVSAAPAPEHTADHISSGHFHASGWHEHHHHALGDASVVRTGDDAGMEQNGDSAGSLLGAFAALLSDPVTWEPLQDDAARAMHRPWALVTHDPVPQKRPPRQV